MIGFYRYWKVEKSRAFWNFIPDTQEAIDKAVQEGAMYVTCLAISGPSDNGNEPLRYGSLSFDFDNEDPCKAIEEMRCFVAHLKEVYRVDPNQINIFLSGGKGGHIEIDPKILGATPGQYLNLEYKRIAAKLKADLDLETLDMSLYSGGKGKMFRLPNVQRANGRYKIQILHNELVGLENEQLLSLTESPRDLNLDERLYNPQLVEPLHKLFLQSRKSVRAELEEAHKQTLIDPENLKALKYQVPECIRAILGCKRKTGKINFNKLVLNLSSYFASVGYDKKTAWEMVKDFIENFQESATYKTIKDRKKHWQAMFDYVQGNQAYAFSCSYVKGLGLPGNLFDCVKCPANSELKPTREEFEDKINSTSNPDILTYDILKEIAGANLTKAIRHRLLKMIAKKVGCTVNDLLVDCKKYLDSPEDQQLEYARTIISRIGADNIITDKLGVRSWNNSGIWRRTEDRELKKKAHDVIADNKVSKSVVDSVIDLIKTETFKPDHVWDQKTTGVNVLNGELHFNGEDWELKPHCRENYRTTQLPVEYDPQAEAPRFKKFLSEIVEPDEKEEGLKKIHLILEMMGYAILTTAKYEKFFILVGPGANGKSILLHTLEALVGRNHCSSIQPSQLANQFYRAHLYNKLINVISELKVGAEIADDWLKKITSGELTSADEKFKPPFEFKPYCTCIFATNHLPHTRDFSEALFRRAVMIEFNRTFDTDEQDVNLKDKLSQELPGILNLVLLRIGQVIKTGQFTEPESSKALKHKWRLEADQAAQFLEDVCEVGPNFWTASKEIYDAYKNWAEEVGIRKALNMKTLGMRLQKLGVADKRSTGGTRGYSLSLKFNMDRF